MLLWFNWETVSILFFFFFLYSTTVQVQFSSKTWENKNIVFHQTLSSKLIHKYIEIKIRNHSKNDQNNRRER